MKLDKQAVIRFDIYVDDEEVDLEEVFEKFSEFVHEQMFPGVIYMDPGNSDNVFVQKSWGLEESRTEEEFAAALV